LSERVASRIAIRRWAGEDTNYIRYLNGSIQNPAPEYFGNVGLNLDILYSLNTHSINTYVGAGLGAYKYIVVDTNTRETDEQLQPTLGLTALASYPFTTRTSIYTVATINTKLSGIRELTFAPDWFFINLGAAVSF